MRVETDHRIVERGDNRMVLTHFKEGHAYILAERQRTGGKWTVSTVHENVVAEHARHAATLDEGVAPPPGPRRIKDVAADTRHDAVEAMLAMVLEALPREGYSIFVPYDELSDGGKLHLRDKP